VTTINDLFNELVPSCGKCDTFAGELVRAAVRVRREAYNNGNLNNASGAWNFLIVYLGETMPLIEKPWFRNFNEVIFDKIDEAVIEASTRLRDMPSPCDMFALRNHVYDDPKRPSEEVIVSGWLRYESGTFVNGKFVLGHPVFINHSKIEAVYRIDDEISEIVLPHHTVTVQTEYIRILKVIDSGA
jgi:hypothetical protein